MIQKKELETLRAALLMQKMADDLFGYLKPFQAPKTSSIKFTMALGWEDIPHLAGRDLKVVIIDDPYHPEREAKSPFVCSGFTELEPENARVVIRPHRPWIRIGKKQTAKEPSQNLIRAMGNMIRAGLVELDKMDRDPKHPAKGRRKH